MRADAVKAAVAHAVMQENRRSKTGACMPALPMTGVLADADAFATDRGKIADGPIIVRTVTATTVKVTNEKERVIRCQDRENAAAWPALRDTTVSDLWARTRAPHRSS